MSKWSSRKTGQRREHGNAFQDEGRELFGTDLNLQMQKHKLFLILNFSKEALATEMAQEIKAPKFRSVAPM